MKDSIFYGLLALVIALCLAGSAALVLHTVELRENVSILSYIATEGL